MRTTVVRRVLGIAFIGAVVFALWLTYAVFDKTFSTAATVELKTSRIGLQLNKSADVKLRGMIVGEVRETSTDGSGATVELALERDELEQIPHDVSARILPKTLFGEKYVDLVLPAGAHGSTSGRRPIADGDTITRDKSRTSIELERLLDDIYPLLRAVKPADLSATLNALATALEGRGDRLGDNLERLSKYLPKLKPHLPTLTKDLGLLADVARIYDDATPDLVRLLDNAVKTGNTVTLKQRELDDFLTKLAGASDHTRRVLDRNEKQLIKLGQVSRPTLDLLEEYSPEYTCLLGGMVNWIPRFQDAFGGGEHYSGSAPSMHVTLEIVGQRNAYDESDAPEYNDDRGPGCRGLPDPPYSQENPAPPANIDDGVGEQPGPGVRNPVFDTTGGYAGSVAEKRDLQGLLAPATNTAPKDVPDLEALMFGSLARGGAVNVR